jgi:hypothetical protein
MTSDEFHGLVEECSDQFGETDGDAPLTLAQLKEFEQQKGIRFPAFYKEFISTYGAGEFGSVTVLSPDPQSIFPIWETTARLENRECNFMGVVESDSNYYGFLIEQGVCSNETKSATQVTATFLISSQKWRSESGMTKRRKLIRKARAHLIIERVKGP